MFFYAHRKKLDASNLKVWLTFVFRVVLSMKQDKPLKAANKPEIKADIKSSNPAERMKAIRQNKPVGAVKAITKIKQRLSVDSWQALCDYLTTEGAEKYMQVLKDAPGKDFIIGFNSILEYHKPKLIRSDNRNINVNIDKEDINFI